ncbi:MAG: isoprenylcysteine carboxylmethyltransferase family protein [Anaerolineales bacterium]|nr:isoprenylcysteine carboxylmethyltransferase family protein [Anaerolineales bacterium]NUQ85126.1 isoprenylcysteine carboxylmethyltransferase family protein [Anaerolineales bacterium]
MTALKSLFFFILAPGLLMGYFPYLISTMDAELFNPGVVGYLAFPLWFVGWTVMIWCFWIFIANGRGTPAPVDPPRELVIVGPYRFVRNPMYAAGIIALLGWIFWSPSIPLIAAPFLFFLAAYLFVIFYEEPTLKNKFGAAYDEYARRVPRWMPKLRDR